MFGTFIKELRARQHLGLREFCLEHGHDPGNWSKIEREVLSPPSDEAILRKWAKQLGLKENTDDWLKFFEFAAVDAGRIPNHIRETRNCLPSFPRSSARFPATAFRARNWKISSNCCANADHAKC
jgi:transcriptional regulator with XRE-family HTH domain